MTWKPIPDSAKSLLEGVEFGMTDGAKTCLCSISQQEIDKWADHIGKIDRHIAFELFRGHESEIYAAAARILDETPFVEMRMTAEDRWPWGQPRIPSRVRDLTARRSVSLTQELRAALTELPMTRALEAWVTEG